MPKFTKTAPQNLQSPAPTISAKSASHVVTPLVTELQVNTSMPKSASKAALAMHRQWQQQAEAVGGPSARIVVQKVKAKKLIFDLLHDAFLPMNITQIHKVKLSSRIRRLPICHSRDALPNLFCDLILDRRSKRWYHPRSSSLASTT
jgi:hypothetical protein